VSFDLIQRKEKSMSIDSSDRSTNEETPRSTAPARRPRGDGDDPPHDADQNKPSGSYPLISRGPGDDPPHDADQHKTGYPVESE
jgi:hypothetical protein